MAPLRLDSKLLFYGLDSGTWSDPPPSATTTPVGPASAGGCCGWGGSSPWISSMCDVPQEGTYWVSPSCGSELGPMNSIKALWGGGGGGGGCEGLQPSGRGGGLSASAGAFEPSTDEGSEPKGGSESDSAPDSNEGLLSTSPQPTPHQQHLHALQVSCMSMLPPAEALQALSLQSPVAHQQLMGGAGGCGCCGSLVTSPVAAAMQEHEHVAARQMEAALACGLVSASAAHAQHGVVPQDPAAAAAAAAAAAVYASYLPADYGVADASYLAVAAAAAAAAHSFGGGEASGQYGYEQGFPVTAAGMQPGTPGSSVGVPQGPDGIPSIGSYAHLSGQCSRCCFHPKGRCANGYSCQFCHFDHDKRPRNGKKKRYRRTADDGTEVLIEE